jgi:hypothetical protein
VVAPRRGHGSSRRAGWQARAVVDTALFVLPRDLLAAVLAAYPAAADELRERCLKLCATILHGSTRMWWWGGGGRCFTNQTLKRGAAWRSRARSRAGVGRRRAVQKLVDWGRAAALQDGGGPATATPRPGPGKNLAAAALHHPVDGRRFASLEAKVDQVCPASLPSGDNVTSWR